MKVQPPKIAWRFFRWFCREDYLEEIEGDLVEVYEMRHSDSAWRAKLSFIWSVITYFRPGFIRSFHLVNNSNFTAMFQHNLLISFRNFQRYKSTFLINLSGLAGGLASALLIYLWVYDEINMNRFHEKDSDRHFQVMYSYPTSGTIHTDVNGSTPNPLYKALAEDLPEVDYSFPVVFYENTQGVLAAGDKFSRARYQFIGKGYYNVFPGEYLHGNKHEVLSDKGEVVISEKLALSLFESTEAAMGQLVEFKEEYYGGNYLVSGVFRPAANTSEKFDMIFSYELFADEEMMQWYNGGTHAHLIMKEGVDMVAFNAKIKDFLTTKYKTNEILYAQAFADRYLYGKYENGLPVPGRIVYVRIFSIIALVILAIACINYMNFSTAKASRRVKEIGVKKAIGAARRSLIMQYFGESVFMAFLSLITGLILVVLLLPEFNAITGKELTFDFSPEVMLSVLAITLVTGLVSGIYPALHLSGFKPVLALKGKLTREGGALWLRKGLVIFQFAISVTLIVSVIVIYKQVEFIQTKNLGYNKDNIITIPREGKLNEDADAFLTEIRRVSGVTKATQMWGQLPGMLSYTHGYKWDGMSEADRKLRFYRIGGGHELIDLLGIELKEGRGFSQDFATDEHAVIMNEKAIEMMNFEEPVGKPFGNLNPRVKTKEIIGVVKNFHFQSLQENMKPFFFYLTEGGNRFVVKIQAGTERETIDQIKTLYESFNEGYPFEFKFLDDNYQAQYAAEARITVLSQYFAGIAIAISCLGLLALTAFSTQRRFREIIIRKVLGSDSFNIVKLLSREFIWLVFAAILIALPVSYYLMRGWLDGFAYRISLDPVYFVLAGIVMLITASLTIMSQTARSAKVNVSKGLRVE